VQVDRVLASDNVGDGAATTGLASAGLVGLVLVRHCDGVDWVRWALNGKKRIESAAHQMSFKVVEICKTSFFVKRTFRSWRCGEVVLGT